MVIFVVLLIVMGTCYVVTYETRCVSYGSVGAWVTPPGLSLSANMYKKNHFGKC